MTPSWIFDLLAAVVLVVAAVAAARAAAAWAWRRESGTVDADVAHLLMGVAMAGMLAPSLRTFPTSAWEVAFGAATAWFAFRVVRDARVNGIRALSNGHCAPHLVHSGAMLYMFLATTPIAGMAGMSGMNELPGSAGSTMLTLNDPTLAFAFALALIGYGVWDLDQLSARRYRLAGVPALAGAEPGAAMISIPGSGAARDQAAPSGPSGSSGGGGAGGGTAGDPVADRLFSPAVAGGCRVAMGVAMAFILLIAI
jgi:hypothetical protein